MASSHLSPGPIAVHADPKVKRRQRERGREGMRGGGLWKEKLKELMREAVKK